MQAMQGDRLPKHAQEVGVGQMQGDAVAFLHHEWYASATKGTKGSISYRCPCFHPDSVSSHIPHASCLLASNWLMGTQIEGFHYLLCVEASLTPVEEDMSGRSKGNVMRQNC